MLAVGVIWPQICMIGFASCNDRAGLKPAPTKS